MNTKNKYRIYFKWLGEKKRIDIIGETIHDAENQLLDKLEIIHTKLIEGKEPIKKQTDLENQFDNIMNMFGIK